MNQIGNFLIAIRSNLLHCSRLQHELYNKLLTFERHTRMAAYEHTTNANSSTCRKWNKVKQEKGLLAASYTCQTLIFRSNAEATSSNLTHWTESISIHTLKYAGNGWPYWLVTVMSIDLIVLCLFFLVKIDCTICEGSNQCVIGFCQSELIDKALRS